MCMLKLWKSLYKCWIIFLCFYLLDKFGYFTQGIPSKSSVIECSVLLAFGFYFLTLASISWNQSQTSRYLAHFIISDRTFSVTLWTWDHHFTAEKNNYWANLHHHHVQFTITRCCVMVTSQLLLCFSVTYSTASGFCLLAELSCGLSCPPSLVYNNLTSELLSWQWWMHFCLAETRWSAHLYKIV